MADSPMWVEGDPGDNRYNADEYRHWQEAIRGGATGVYPTTGLLVSQRAAGANMSVDVAVGTAFVAGSEEADQGMYAQHIGPSAVNRTIAAAHASNARRDIVGIQIEDKAISGSVDAGDVVVITGTASGSPVDPTLPDNFLPLARVAVAASATTIVNANITDLREGGTIRYGWDPNSGLLRPWDCAWGFIEQSVSTTDHVLITAEQNITGVSIQWNAVANRFYKTTVHMPRCQQVNNPAEMQAFITDGSNSHITGGMWAHYFNENEVDSIHIVLVEGGIPAGSLTRKLRVSSTFANGKVMGESSPGHITVEDVGAAGAP